MKLKNAQLLGEPLSAVGISAAGCGMYNGKPQIYAVGSGTTCAMFVIDVETGKCVKKMDLKGSSHTWGVSVASDGTVYAGGDGYFYRYIPGQDEVERLGKPIETETYFWQTTIDESDRPYCGTFPTGSVFRYNPVIQSFETYGQIVEGEQYVRSIVAVNNKIYAGVGSKAHLVELDPETGKKQHISLPQGYEDSSFVSNLSAAYPLLFAYIKDGLHIYHLEQNCWVGKLEKVSIVVSKADEHGHVYFTQDQQLCYLDVETMEVTSTGIRCGGVSNLSWLDLELEEFSGRTLVSANSGGYWLYHPSSGRHKVVKVELAGIPVAIQSLTTGADDTIYIGGYFRGGLATYSTTNDEFTDCQPFGQTENMLEHQGKLYLGVYPHARIYCYDKADPWKNNVNPELKFSLDAHGQDRPFAFAHADQYLAIGTVPSYGTLGGALTLYQAEEDKHEVFSQVVYNQSIICLTYRDGILYGGTSVFGGLGIKPTEAEGKLFMFDITTRSKIWEGTPIPGEKAVSALCVTDDGFIWGLTRCSIFRFDPIQKVFDKVVRLATPPEWEELTHFWRGEFIQYDAVNQALKGNFRNKLFKYDLNSDQIEFFEEQINLFTQDSQGHAYYARGSELYRFHF